MSSFDLKNFRRAVLAAVVVAPALAGCGYQPLYGSGFGGSGIGVAQKLAAVDIAIIPGRVGQEVRNELIFKETGGRDAPPPHFRLEVALRESNQSLLVNAQGQALNQDYTVDADFRLIDIATQKVLLTARSNARAGYQQEVSTFANVRARRDAEDRAARSLADSIRTQVASYLSQTG